jgi:hypothetical protein
MRTICFVLCVLLAQTVRALVFPVTGALRLGNRKASAGLLCGRPSHFQLAGRGVKGAGLQLAAAGDEKDISQEGTPDQSSVTGGKGEDEKKELLVLGFNLLDYNDWITIVLSGIIAWQSFGIGKDIIAGITAGLASKST